MLAGLKVPVNNRNLGMVVSGGIRLPNMLTEFQSEKWDIDLRLQIEVWVGRNIDGAPQNQVDLRVLGLLGSQLLGDLGMDVCPACPSRKPASWEAGTAVDWKKVCRSETEGIGMDQKKDSFYGSILSIDEHLGASRNSM